MSPKGLRPIKEVFVGRGKIRASDADLPISFKDSLIFGRN